MNKPIFIVLILLLTSCQTVQPVEDLGLSIPVQRLFQKCSSKGGGLVLQSRDSKVVFPELMIDWVSKTESTWMLETFDAIGRSVLNIDFAAPVLVVDGPLASKLPQITSDSEGFFLVDGQFMGLKVKEIPCLLQGALPEEWMLSSAIKKVENKKVHIKFIEQDRNITVRFDNIEKPYQICSRFEWSYFLGLRKASLVWCFLNDKSKKTVLTAKDYFSIGWQNYE